MAEEMNININVTELSTLISSLRDLAEALASHFGHAAPGQAAEFAAKIEEGLDNDSDVMRSIHQKIVGVLRDRY